jgi:flagellar assembly factor FliW
LKSGFENYTGVCFIKSDSTVPLVVMKQAKDYDFFFSVSFVAALLG